jgi:hypothetical protein
MLAKCTALSQIECTPSGAVQLRLDKQIVDGDNIVASSYHRTVFLPGGDLDAQVSLVNEHLSEMGYPAMPDAVIERLRRIIAVEHTPAVVAAYAAAQEERADAAIQPRAP